MDKKIEINEEIMNSKIDTLKQLKNNLQAAFDKQNNNSLEIQKFWGGNNGEKALEILEDHNKEFTNYIDSLDKKIKYLESIRDTYKAFDEQNSNKIE